MYIAAYAVFGRIKPDKLYVGCFEEYVDCRFEVVVYAGGIGDEAHAFASEAFEVIVAEYFDAGFYLGGSAYGEGGAYCGQYRFFHCFSTLRPKFGSIFMNAQMPIVAAQQIMVQMKK